MELEVDLISSFIPEYSLSLSLSLSLYNTFESGEGAGAIFQEKVFPGQKKLKRLDLSGTGIGEKHCVGILKSLVNDEIDLELLGMSENDISSDSATVIAAYIKQCCALKVLNLEGNELKSEGATQICNALVESKCPIETINLYNNEITALTVPALIKLIRSKPSLKKLNLDANMISAKGVNVIKDTLKELKKDDCLDEMEMNDDENEEGEDDIDGLTKMLEGLST
mmetsp:Transcript_20953/g.29227  ORF Transcript_20953/g.29227 Transcript_20953/m.29227 type:complete len:225 (-) Transcript_20953:298-972(-)